MKQINKVQQYFQKQREIFNMEVEKKLQETGIKKVILAEDNYDSAKTICVDCTELHKKITKAKNQHPEYRNNEIKYLVLNQIIESDKEEVSLSEKNSIKEIIDNYFLYESCGFFQLYEIEIELNKLTKENNDKRFVFVKRK